MPPEYQSSTSNAGHILSFVFRRSILHASDVTPYGVSRSVCPAHTVDPSI